MIDVETLIARLQSRGDAVGSHDEREAARLLIVYRATLAWLATHDLTVGCGRRGQTIAARALQHEEAPTSPGVVRT